jgi:solute:Na+ symporter, SSS family
MHPVDWAIVVVYISWLVWDGVKRTRLERTTESYFLANRSLPWWAVGLSVMATQLSAITLVGTTGQGYNDGMRFIQFYYGLPIAMVLVGAFCVPFFFRARVYTAYEYLERRFDPKTRALTSLLFLFSRAMACGAIVAAPAVVLSVILGWDVTTTTLVILVPAIVYTMLGGVQAVTWTDVKVMGLTVFVLVAAIVFLVAKLPDGVSVTDALRIAGSTGRLTVVDTRVTLTETYTVWSGLIGGLFLMLSYFGCDQSQVQRYLTAKSVDEGRSSLMMSAYWKIPLQVLVLLVGIFTFVYYIFHPPPMLFNAVHEREVRSSARASEYQALEQEFAKVYAARREAALRVAQTDGVLEEAKRDFREEDAHLKKARATAVEIVRDATRDKNYNDVNYMFPTFITTALPIGLVGLWIVAIITAATDSIAAELNSLAAVSVMDFYRRYLVRTADDHHYVLTAKVATAIWGVFAGVVAIYASTLGSLIEVVNRFGSYFYGSILGVFILAFFVRGANGTGAFLGLIAGMASVRYVAVVRPDISFLWHNVIGAVVVVAVGWILSLAARPRSVAPAS